MKLTSENRKALEDAVKSVTINDMGDYTRINVKKPQVSTKDPVVLLQAAALLLEIWEPLQEMVEARGKIGEVVWTEYHNDYDISDGFGHVGSFEHKETRDFAIKAANSLAAIRKAVEVLTSKELLLEAAKASYEDNNAALKAEVERLRGVIEYALDKCSFRFDPENCLEDPYVKLCKVVNWPQGE